MRRCLGSERCGDRKTEGKALEEKLRGNQVPGRR